MRHASARRAVFVLLMGSGAACADGPGGPGSPVPRDPASASLSSSASVAAREPGCTGDPGCGAGDLCVEGSCESAEAWTNRVRTDRGKKLALLRRRMVAGIEARALVEERALAVALEAARIEGAAAWEPGHRWLTTREGLGAGRGTELRFLRLAMFDATRSPPESMPGPLGSSDLGKLPGDVDALWGKFHSYGGAELRDQLADLDNNIAMLERSAGGLERPPVYMVELVRDRSLKGKAWEPCPEAPPVRRTHVVYFYVVDLRMTMLRVTVEVDSPAETSLSEPSVVPSCAEAARTAAGAASVTLVSALLAKLRADSPLPADRDEYRALRD